MKWEDFQAIVVGTSAGGFLAVKALLSELSSDLRVAVIIVQHLSNRPNDRMLELLGEVTRLPVKEAEDKEPIVPGTVYICPPNYHLLVEMAKCFTLSADPKVNYSRPSIDVLFESAAEVYRQQLVGVVLTGANADGSAGLQLIKEFGGMTIVQDPQEAAYSEMPQAAWNAVEVDAVLSLREIAELINSQFANPG